jgi:predicted RNA-binding Zn-ribbon protein involved in translation (DUF1610 family)
MKPRNKTEEKVMQMSEQLPSITDKQLLYALEHGFTHKAVLRSKKKHTYVCLDCGETIEAGREVKRIKCPNCGHTLTTDGAAKMTQEISSFRVITTCEDWQVERTWYMKKYTRKFYDCEHEIYEVVQQWMHPSQKKSIVVARSRLMHPYYCDHFNKYSPMSIKEHHYVNYHYYGDPYSVEAKVIYPHKRIIKELKKRGYCNRLIENVTFNSVFSSLMGEPKMETIAKMHRYDLWDYFTLSYTSNFLKDYWSQIKIMMRHDYYPCDMKLWVDTIELAKRFHYDIFSPKYCTPDNLQVFHDLLVRKQNKLDREKEIAENKKKEKKFLERFEKYFGICLHYKDITIRPLKSFEEFYDEGKSMHHCVASYFGKTSNLILTARTDKQRLATIELDSKTFEVLQCRAIQNNVPERQAEICNLIAQHKQDFIKASLCRKAS